MEHIDTGRLDLAKIDLQDAVDLALVIEGEARERYGKFAQLVGGRYESDADEVFRAMTALEAKHCTALAERRRQVFGDAPSRIDASALLDVEAPDWNAIRVFMGPQDALRVALDAESRAFDFFDVAARKVQDPAARVFLEEQRAEEADHCRALQAWMQMVPPGPDLEDDDADPPGSDAA